MSSYTIFKTSFSFDYYRILLRTKGRCSSESSRILAFEVRFSNYGANPRTGFDRLWQQHIDKPRYELGNSSLLHSALCVGRHG